MKIIHLIGGGDVGGAKTHIYSLLTGLMKQGIEVKLVSFRKGGFADEAASLGIDVEIIANKNPLADFGALRRLYRQGGYDLVHCHGAKGNMMGCYLKIREKAVVISTVHSDPKLDYMGRPLGALTYGTINKLALRLIRYKIGVADTVTEMLIDRGFSPYGIFTIYNGLDFGTTDRGFDREKYLAGYGIRLEEGDMLCGIAARLNPVKDIPTLLRAVAKTPQQVKLMIAGDGELLDELVSLSDLLGISGRVFFVGWLSGTEDFFRAIDVNLLTSVSEGFPYSITEGARGRCATISSDVGGIGSLIDSGANGYLFNPGDDSTLAMYLTRYAEDRELREKFAERLYRKAAGMMSIEATISAQQRIYETALRREGKNARRLPGITVCGAYGRGNAGDDAILEAIISELRDIDPDRRITVMSRSPRSTRKSYRADSVYTFNPFSAVRAFIKSKLYINGGGSLMQDVTSTRSILFYLWTIRLAKLCGCKVMMFGCGIGPISKQRNRKRTRKALNSSVDAITLRERVSAEELAALGVTKPEIILAADPVFRLSPAEEAMVDSALISNGIDGSREYICFAVRSWQGFDEKAAVFARAADMISEKYGYVTVFIPIEHRQDSEAARRIAEHMKTPFILAQGTGKARITMGVLSRMRVVVSMRLHGLIFAAGQGVPLVGISYDPKVMSFMDYMELDYCMSLEEVSVERLREFIEKALLLDKDALARSVERLKTLENGNFVMAEKLINS
ncbi:MAG: polysaccharide pyruvyl transferase CsaB [Oscillospiraceae bacterium]|jgi:polysaccharide pyruvyl transferase CsaB|nr:polysaccharide pyruvyl transferase CsaB [Oscillospiraceae bacterium]